MYRASCGRPKWSFVHAPDHPANKGNEDITHPFVAPAEPTYTTGSVPF